MKRFAPTSSGSPVRGQRPFLLLVTLAGSLLVAGILLLAGCGDDDANPSFPPDPKPEPDRWYFDVQGTAADDVWVAGNAGIMYHFDGAGWTLNDLNSDHAVTKIHVEDQNTLYACGHGGSIWRNTGGGWSGMSTPTSRNLYGIGSFGGEIHAVGHDGTVLRLGGGWSDVGGSLIVRDATRDDAPLDTLSLTQDVATLTTVNHYFIGGAYRLPTYTGIEEGMLGTDGMVLGEDTYFDPDLRFDWLLRPVRGSRATNVHGLDPEWITCTTSDEQNLANNYLGTTKGWLFQLEEDLSGARVWTKNLYRVTTTDREGIRDMWVDAAANLYLVTSEGQVLYQEPDGTRTLLYEQKNSLVGIWGSAPGDLYLVGYMNETILHAVHDAGAGTFNVEYISLPFPDKSLGERSAFDELGRPRR